MPSMRTTSKQVSWFNNTETAFVEIVSLPISENVKDDFKC